MNNASNGNARSAGLSLISMGEAGRRRVEERFPLSGMIEEPITVYNEVVSPPTGARGT